MNSCEGIKCASGTIHNAKTKQPVDSVKCEVLLVNENMFSDKNGQFEICIKIGGIMHNTPDIEVILSKKGYKSKTVINPKNDEIIFLDIE